jgi:hypothetical protein
MLPTVQDLTVAMDTMLATAETVGLMAGEMVVEKALRMKMP